MKQKYEKSKIRCEKILEASLDLFLEKGYAATSLNDIIERSGGSLSTIYKYFDNKDSLFKVIIKTEIEKFKAIIEARMEIDEGLDLRQYLHKFGEIYLQILFSDKTIKFHKLVLSEGFKGSIVETGKFFLENGIIGSNSALTNFFKKNSGKFHNDMDAENLAIYYCFLLREPYFHRAVFFGENIKFGKTQKLKHIHGCINTLFNGVLK